MRIGDLLANVVDRSPCLAKKTWGNPADPLLGMGNFSRKGEFLGMNRQLKMGVRSAAVKYAVKERVENLLGAPRRPVNAHLHREIKSVKP